MLYICWFIGLMAAVAVCVAADHFFTEWEKFGRKK